MVGKEYSAVVADASPLQTVCSIVLHRFRETPG
jgi:hypothetical protein